MLAGAPPVPPSVFANRADRPSRLFNLHNPMAREKGPLGRKCPAPRKNHRKSVRPLRNAGKERAEQGYGENEKNWMLREGSGRRR